MSVRRQGGRGGRRGGADGRQPSGGGDGTVSGGRERPGFVKTMRCRGGVGAEPARLRPVPGCNDLRRWQR